ncbi:MAG: hypothetical protein ACFFD4_20510 [Candidatus Odinarchaeota archaeon]
MRARIRLQYVNADLNGARNILNKYLRAASRSGEVLVGALTAPW